MVREVADGILVAHGLIADGKLIGIREAVKDRDLHIAGIAALAVRTLERELQARVRNLAPPELVVEARIAAMDVVLVMAARIEVELVRPAIDRDLAARDAVRVAADDAAHTRIVRLIARDAIVAEHDVDGPPRAILRLPAHEPRAVVRHGRLRPLRIA